MFLFFFVSISISFLTVFLLQFSQPVTCMLIFPRSEFEDSYLMDKYYENYSIYLYNLEQKLKQYDLTDPNQLTEYQRRAADLSLGQIMVNSRDRYAGAKPFSYDPCHTQAYTNDFKTFFGNIVSSDFSQYNQYVEGSYTSEQMKQVKFSSTEIIYEDHYVRLMDWTDENFPPSYYITNKYRRFVTKFSQCDCDTISHKTYVRFRGMWADWIPASIIGIILTTILSLIWKYSFKIKITK